jgi:hypothetical protein
MTEPESAHRATQALRDIGKKLVDDTQILRLRSLLTDAEKQRLLKATRFGVDWIYQAARRIVGAAA